MSEKKAVAILVSGGGSNMVALVDSMLNDPDHPGRPCLVLSNNADAGGLKRAAERGVATAVVDHRPFGSDRAAFEAELVKPILDAGADVVYAKSWGALPYFGRWDEEKPIRDQYKHFIVDEAKMALTNNAIFSHCLPVRRNVKVTDAVIDSPQSMVIDEAENRLIFRIDPIDA